MILKMDEEIKIIETKIQQGCIQEMHELLFYTAKKLQPKNYLEIGVWKGRSMALVLKASCQTKGFGIDTWAFHAGFENLTPKDLMKNFQDLELPNLPTLLSGKSSEKLPEHWERDEIPQLFQLILVDGDHNYEAAQKDLELCFLHLDKGGVLVFHDTVLHPYLADLFLTFKKKLTDFIFVESYFGCGTAVALKLPLRGKIL